MKRTTFNLARALRTLEGEALAVTEEGTLRQRFVEALSRFLEAASLSNKGVLPRVDERLVTGRPDARVGGLVFEVKLPSPKGPGIEVAISEAADYMKEFEKKHKRPALGVGYDGLTIAFLEEGKVAKRGRPSALASTIESWLISLGGEPLSTEHCSVTAPTRRGSPTTRLRILSPRGRPRLRGQQVR